MKKPVSKFVGLLWAMLFLFSCGGESTVQEITQNHLKAVGGKERLAEIKTARVSGNTFRNGKAYPFEAFYLLPDRYYLKSEPVIQAVDEHGAWSQYGEEPPVRDTRMMDDILSFFTGFPSPLVHYTEKKYKLEWLGRFTEDGRDLDKVRVHTPNNGTWYVFLDASTHLEYKRQYLARWDTSQVFFESVFEEYRRFDSIAIPVRVADYAQGRKLSEMVLDTAEFGVPLAEGLFSLNTYDSSAAVGPARDDGPTPLTDLAKLKEVFQKDRGKVRMVTILSPT